MSMGLSSRAIERTWAGLNGLLLGTEIEWLIASCSAGPIDGKHPSDISASRSRREVSFPTWCVDDTIGF